MIDLHTHILPGIDDGSQSCDMTRQMLTEEKLQGVRIIVVTPHFYADKMSVDSFLKRREEALKQTKEVLHIMEQEDPAHADELPRLLTGAEVYYFPGMGSAGALKELCIEGTKAILLEMPFEQWDESVYRDVKEIIEKQDLHVILAHTERYLEFQKDKKVWHKVLELPVTIQLNTGNFIRKSRLFHTDHKKKLCLQLMAERDNVILGSDCHNMSGRRPNLGPAKEAIEKQLGEQVFAASQQKAKEVLNL